MLHLKYRKMARVNESRTEQNKTKMALFSLDILKGKGVKEIVKVTQPGQYSRSWSWVRASDPHRQPFEVRAIVVAATQERNLQHRAAESLP